MRIKDGRITPLILAGGQGKRLWPLSRPKQFEKLYGNHSLFQQTVLRMTRHSGFHAPVIVGNIGHRKLIDGQLRDIGVPSGTTVFEPLSRNTAPAILAAALHIEEKAAGDFLLVLPTDHLIGDFAPLRAAIEQALPVAAAGKFVTFGMTPTVPESGYGYIGKGAALTGGAGYLVESFIEKPSRETAQDLVESGEYLWNCGVFLFPVTALLEEMRRFHPTLVQTCENALRHATGEDGEIHLDKTAFALADDTPIDIALMERSGNAVVFPVDLSWADIGSWTAIDALNRQSRDQNITEGNVILKDVTGAYVKTSGPVTAVIGLDDVIVVNTGDAVIVVSKSHAQDVRHIAEKLEKEGIQPHLSDLP